MGVAHTWEGDPMHSPTAWHNLVPRHGGSWGGEWEETVEADGQTVVMRADNYDMIPAYRSPEADTEAVRERVAAGAGAVAVASEVMVGSAA